MEYKEIERTVEEQGTSMERETLTHPAFGLIGFSRVSGGENTLFGSSIKHNDRIIMRLKHAKQDRHLHDDWYHGRGLITEVEMSYSQFAECISSLNVGEGVPCTIRYTEKDGMVPYIKENVSKREQFRNEFSETVSKAMEQVQEQMDRTTLEAKGEIEAFCQNKINSIAQAALVENRDKFVALENPVEL